VTQGEAEFWQIVVGLFAWAGYFFAVLLLGLWFWFAITKGRRK
jgi:hypothetical protein